MSSIGDNGGIEEDSESAEEDEEVVAQELRLRRRTQRRAARKAKLTAMRAKCICSSDEKLSPTQDGGQGQGQQQAQAEPQNEDATPSAATQLVVATPPAAQGRRRVAQRQQRWRRLIPSSCETGLGRRRPRARTWRQAGKRVAGGARAPGYARHSTGSL